MSRRPHIDSPGQLQIDWTARVPTVSPLSQPRSPSPQPRAAEDASTSPLVQLLPWNFKTTFPQPTDEAIENDVLEESDREPENLKALHANYAAHCLASLTALDKVSEARRLGVDPATGKKPRTHAARERLRKYLDDEPQRLEHAFEVLTETYGDGFGQDAAGAFRKAITAWHAGIQVVAEHSANAAPVNAGKKRTSRISSSLPVPCPLQSSVAAGVFGHDEDGNVIRPTAAEVRALIEQHAENLIELISSLPSPGSSPNPITRNAPTEIQAALAKYAEDFGQQAAAQLEAHVHRQVRLLKEPASPAGRRR